MIVECAVREYLSGVGMVGVRWYQRAGKYVSMQCGRESYQM
jgi:hypothetical protein